MVSHLVWILLVFAQVDSSGTSLTIEAVRALTISSSENYSESHWRERSRSSEDFQKWSKKTETLFAGAIKSVMILGWSAEQVTASTQELIDLDFLPTSTNEERRVHTLDYVLQQVLPALMSLTSYEANYIVANSRKN